MREITFREAINEALREEMRRDRSVFVMGEDIGYSGGVRLVTKGLFEEFGCERVRDTPLAEAGFVGAAVGAALTGTRPVVEVMYSDFLALCFDEIFDLAAKWRYTHGGQMKVPLDGQVLLWLIWFRRSHAFSSTVRHDLHALPRIESNCSFHTI